MLAVFYSFIILEIFGIGGCLWTITVVLVSKHVSFTKTKYFYFVTFLSDIGAIIFMLGLDKSLYFLWSFDQHFFEGLENSSSIVCKLTGY